MCDPYAGTFGGKTIFIVSTYCTLDDCSRLDEAEHTHMLAAVKVTLAGVIYRNWRMGGYNFPSAYTPLYYKY